jgi:hypothetical protein
MKRATVLPWPHERWLSAGEVVPMGGFFQDAPGGLAYGRPMTSMTPMTRTATFRARGGRGAQLAERLLRAASLMADVPGARCGSCSATWTTPT